MGIQDPTDVTVASSDEFYHLLELDQRRYETQTCKNN